MTDQLLLVSRIALLVLVYLVFLRVARAVIVEIRAEAKVGSPAAATRTPTPAPVGRSAAGPAGSSSPDHREHRLTVVAPGSLDGTSFALSSETTIGRAPGCAVSLDDARISKLHARLFTAEGKWLIEDLDSTNGTTVNGRPLTGPRPLDRRDRIQVGEVTLEFS